MFLDTTEICVFPLIFLTLNDLYLASRQPDLSALSLCCTRLHFCFLVNLQYMLVNVFQHVLQIYNSKERRKVLISGPSDAFSGVSNAGKDADSLLLSLGRI